MNLSINFICNDKEIETSLHPATTLLDFLRKHLHLTGTKEACREGDCGACTVLIGEPNKHKVIYSSKNSCLLPLGSVNGKHVITIEGLNQNELTPVQQYFVNEGGTQCGFCTPGFIISLTGYLLNNEVVDPDEAVSALDGNICRCTGYQSIKRSVYSITKIIHGEDIIEGDHLNTLIQNKIIPKYFANIHERLNELSTKINEKITRNGDKELLISGGTDLFVQRGEEISDQEVKFLSRKKKSNGIWLEDHKCYIDALCTISDLQSSEILQKLFPNLSYNLKLFGSLPIRNVATVGGNIVNASPIGDLTIILLALDATLLLKYESIKREVELKDFFKGYKHLNKQLNEILDAVTIPIPNKGTHCNFEKVSRRTHLDIASVNSAIFLETNKYTITKIKLSAGGVAPVPLLMENTITYLTGKEISNEIIVEAAAIAQSEINPITDARGSAEYKKLLLHQLIYAHFTNLFPHMIKIEELV